MTLNYIYKVQRATPAITFSIFILLVGFVESCLALPQIGDIVCAPINTTCTQKCKQITSNGQDIGPGDYMTIFIDPYACNPGDPALWFEGSTAYWVFKGKSFSEDKRWSRWEYRIAFGYTNTSETTPTWPSCPDKTELFLATCPSGEGTYDCATDVGKCDPNPCDSSVDSDGDTYDQCRDCDDDNASRSIGCLKDKQRGQPEKNPCEDAQGFQGR